MNEQQIAQALAQSPNLGGIRAGGAIDYGILTQELGALGIRKSQGVARRILKKAEQIAQRAVQAVPATQPTVAAVIPPRIALPTTTLPTTTLPTPTATRFRAAFGVRRPSVPPVSPVSTILQDIERIERWEETVSRLSGLGRLTKRQRKQLSTARGQLTRLHKKRAIQAQVSVIQPSKPSPALRSSIEDFTQNLPRFIEELEEEQRQLVISLVNDFHLIPFQLRLGMSLYYLIEDFLRWPRIDWYLTAKRTPINSRAVFLEAFDSDGPQPHSIYQSRANCVQFTWNVIQFHINNYLRRLRDEIEQRVEQSERSPIELSIAWFIEDLREDDATSMVKVVGTRSVPVITCSPAVPNVMEQSFSLNRAVEELIFRLTPQAPDSTDVRQMTGATPAVQADSDDYADWGSDGEYFVERISIRWYSAMWGPDAR